MKLLLFIVGYILIGYIVERILTREDDEPDLALSCICIAIWPGVVLIVGIGTLLSWLIGIDADDEI